MNKLINSRQNLGKTEPLACIEATRRAGYEGIGIRTYRSPGQSCNFNPMVGNRDLGGDRDLIPYVQLNDSAREGNAGVLPSEGRVTLYDYLDALPEDVDISVERIRKYLARYATARAELQPA